MISRDIVSLFYPLAVHPPGFLDATEYVRRISSLEGIVLDAENVEVLADLGRSSFAELGLALEVLSANGEMTPSAIVDHFLRSEAATYVDIVANGSPFEHQLLALEEWQCAVSEKISRIGDYLSRIFDFRHEVNIASLRQLERKAKFSDAIMRHADLLRQHPRAFASRARGATFKPTWPLSRSRTEQTGGVGLAQ